MKLTLERTRANVVHAWAPGEIRIRENTYRNNLILSAEHIVDPWPAGSAASLDADDMQPVLELRPDIIVLGTGARIVFPDVELSADILARGIGLEIMDTAAACRTYNVLVHEDRRVVAALILEDT